MIVRITQIPPLRMKMEFTLSLSSLPLRREGPLSYNMDQGLASLLESSDQGLRLRQLATYDNVLN